MVPLNITWSILLFVNDGLIFKNRYAKDNATMEEVRAAATKANAIGFIENNEFGIFLIFIK